MNYTIYLIYSCSVKYNNQYMLNLGDNWANSSDRLEKSDCMFLCGKFDTLTLKV